MAVEHARVLVIEDGRFDFAVEEHLRLAHEVLVERVVGRDEHGETVVAASGPAPLLAQARNRSGKPDRDHGVERPDVHSELERVVARPRGARPRKAPLDLAALARRVAGAIGREPRVIAEAFGRESVNQLGRPATLGERSVRRPRSTSSAISLEASPSVLARRPSSSSSSGGFQKATVRSARGALRRWTPR